MKIEKSKSKHDYLNFRLGKVEFEVEVCNGFIVRAGRRSGVRETDLLVFVQELVKLDRHQVGDIIKSIIYAQKETNG